MDRMRDIDHAIAAQRATITRLQKDIERRQKDIEALKRARVLLAGVSERTRPREHVGVAVGGHPKKGLLDSDSDPGRAHAVLETAGKPLHVNHIIEQIELKFGDRPQRTSLVGALSRYAKHGMHFARVGPNTFALIEWKRD